jgi:hypothetical protein
MQCHFVFADEDCTIPICIQLYYTVNMLDIMITQCIERPFLVFCNFLKSNWRLMKSLQTLVYAVQICCMYVHYP